MAGNGLALFEGKNNKLYALEVLYEYRDKKLAGFRKSDGIYNGNFYKIEPTNEGYKVSTVDFGTEIRAKAPISIHFMKLPGSWVTYDITKQYSNPEEMIQNETVKRVLDKFYGKEKVRKIIKEAVNEIVLKQETPLVSFTAVSIEDESEKQKIENVFKNLQNHGKIPEDFIRPQFKNGEIDYHMTIVTGELPLRFKDDLNKAVVLNVKTIGESDKAIALGVSGDYFSDNEKQHITLAFKEFPKDSKEIENWQPIEVQFTVKGVIREFDKDKKVIQRGVFGEANQIQVGNFQGDGASAGKSFMFPKEKQ